MEGKLPRTDDPTINAYLDKHGIDQVIFELYKQVCKDQPTDLLAFLIEQFSTKSDHAAAILRGEATYEPPAQVSKYDLPLPEPEVETDAEITIDSKMDTHPEPKVEEQPPEQDFGDFDMESSDGLEPVDPAILRARRPTISIRSDTRPSTLPSNERSPEELDLILHALDASPLTTDYDKDLKTSLAKILEVYTVPPGTLLIRQGDPGDYFYILNMGHCIVYKRPKDGPDGAETTSVIPDNLLDEDACAKAFGSKVNEVCSGMGVGDLALLYGAPRAATVITDVESTFWRIEGSDFRVFVREQREEEIRRNQGFLSGVELLKPLNADAIFALAQACKTERYSSGEAIITQGDVGESFYFIVAGDVVVEASGRCVAELHAGEYFGEAALLTNAPRNATCRALVDVTVAVLDRESLDNLLGPLKSMITCRTPDL
ncbi:cAMP-dependent protein kinase regulatory chain [Giardia muris]|uniref:cAMP-dependent protein kinase regulatory chain n=1 Tax=Giardia muris TaxID=5742 RepID=A0A4Z1SLS8_GIAMU|nr:cAMP-dependent protein kinase regulatory chain [Giardia muris]|eukprot:TNJ26614.1 cAMP-dependent protein kinase regulatory chain [Giardia muris]